MAGNKAKDGKSAQRATKAVDRERTPDEPVSYWTTNRLLEGPRKLKVDCAGITAACHDCQRSHIPHRCKSAMAELDACGISMCGTCSHKWRAKYATTPQVTEEQLAKFDKGWCPKCLGICACKRCMSKPCNTVGGGAPVFDELQRREFATHMLAVLKPHVDAYLTARDEEVAAGNDGKQIDLKSIRKVELAERMQCDACAACITDVHRTCSQCGDYDACVRCCHATRKENQDVVCGKCEAAMHLVRRFDAPINTALASIGQVLKEYGVDAGRSHIWDFHATPENQRALAGAGPPNLPVKKQKKVRKSNSPSGEDHEEEDAEAEAEVMADREMIWWVYGNGPEYSYESSQQDSGPVEPRHLSQAMQKRADPSNSGQQADRAETNAATAADQAVEQAGSARGRSRLRPARALTEVPLAARDGTAVCQDTPEPPPASHRPSALSQPQQARQAHLPAQEQFDQLGDHDLAVQQQAEQMDLGHDGMAAADHPMQDVELQEQDEADQGIAEAEGRAGPQSEVTRNVGSSSSGNSADSNVCLPAKSAKATNPPTLNIFHRNMLRAIQPLWSIISMSIETAANGDSHVPSNQVHKFMLFAEEASLRCTKVRRDLKSTRQHYKAQKAAAAAAAQDVQAVDQGPKRQGQARREPLPLYQAPGPALHAAAVPAGPQPAPPQAQPAAAARLDAARQQTAAQAAPGPEAEAEAAAAPPIRPAGTEPAAQTAADRAAPMDAQPAPMQEQAEGDAVDAEGAQKQRKRPGRQEKQGRAVSAAPGAEGSNAEGAGTSAAAMSAVAPHEQGPDWGAVTAVDKRLTAVRQGGHNAAASNYLWTPDAADCAMDSEKRIENSRVFQQQFCQIGKPVVVRGIQPGFFWDPDTLQRATLSLKGMYGKRANKSAPKRMIKSPTPLTVVDQRNMNDYAMKQSEFFKAFIAGGDTLGGSEEPLMLKVKDYPPEAAFAEEMPRHWQDFMQCLPFQEYCHPDGPLNVARYLTSALIKPDLGPKSYIATGRLEEHEEGDSVTKLHVDLSDAINVLVHMEGSSASVRCGNTPAHPQADPTYGGAGAVWDIFQRQDVPKLQAFLNRHCGDFRHGGKPVNPSSIKHAIHSQKFFLNSWHLQQLKEEYGVEPWHFEQHPREGVFIPAGCPHQVRNLASCVKVAVDFVLPESLDQAFKFAEEFRTMGKDEAWEPTSEGDWSYVQPSDRTHTDKLQAELSMCLAAKHAVETLSSQPAEQAKPQNPRRATQQAAGKKAAAATAAGEPTGVAKSKQSKPTAQPKSQSPLKPTADGAADPAGKKKRGRQFVKAAVHDDSEQEDWQPTSSAAAAKTRQADKERKGRTSGRRAAAHHDSEEWNPTSSAATAEPHQADKERKGRTFGRRAAANDDSEGVKPASIAAEAKHEDADARRTAGRGSKRAAKADITSDEDSFSKPIAVKGKKRRSLDTFEEQQSEEDVAARANARGGKRARK